MFELLIKNAEMFDGTGSEPYIADLAVQDGKIAAIGKDLGPAETVVDAQGRALSPGFIDCHSHADNWITAYPDRTHVLRMGVTTEIAGNCGNTQFPVNRGAGDLDGGECFDSLNAFFDRLNQQDLGPNLAVFAGHGNLRRLAMGIENRKAGEQEVAIMRESLRQSLEEGALGYTTGLSYVPGIYADTWELAEVAKELKPYGALYSTHSRSESAGLFKSVQECIDIARVADVPVNISHFKVVGKTFWPRCAEALAMIDQANAEGLTVTLDAYPYTAVSTTTLSAIHPRYLDQGPAAFAKMLENPIIVEELRREIFEIDDPSWDNSALHVGLENFLIVTASQTPWVVGKTYAEVAKEMGVTPYEAMVELLRANHGVIRDVRFAMSEENLEMILKHPLCIVGSDGIYVHGRDKLTHPRGLGTFPRYLGRYIRERKILSRQEGIRRCTGMTADRFHIANKGYLKVGYDADLVLFDFDTIIDHADFYEPFKPNEGIHQVYMQGKLVLEDNEPTGIAMGKCLRRG